MAVHINDISIRIYDEGLSVLRCMMEKNDKKTRSQIMSKIHGKDTKPEVMLRKALWHKGIRYRKNH